MTDIPIIFSKPMVRALMDGRKTMTRRLAWKGERAAWMPSPWQKVRPGDRLWVRENFSGPYEWSDIPPAGWGWDAMARPPIWYWADSNNPEYGDWTRPRPSIHMPRWASRLTLVVTATKIERLQAITDADAQAEGIVEDDGSEPDIWYVPGAANAGWNIRMANRPSKVFQSLWHALHGADAWDANPEVVALTFTVHKQNIDSLPKQEAA